MANWKNGEFEIDGMIVTANTKVEEFEALGKYDVTRGNKGMYLVKSLSNTVDFINIEFRTEMFFSNERLRSIELRPVLKNYNIPNYPDEEYQEYKWNYCKELLKEAFGEASVENEIEVIYKYNGGAISTSKIMGGKAAYTDGNINIYYKE